LTNTETSAQSSQILIVTAVLLCCSSAFADDHPDRWRVSILAGVRVRLTPRTALRAEATRLLRSDGADFDPLTRFGIGVSWVF
jgi:hypothetical protein